MEGVLHGVWGVWLSVLGVYDVIGLAICPKAECTIAPSRNQYLEVIDSPSLFEFDPPSE